MTSNEIRQNFFDFFISKGHHIVPSAPMVIKNDPTLMFTNAGMNQFKDIFLGNEPAKYARVADSQKCLRVSGKHNDLGEVGHDTYHHTMFEMLGNWSFADYFKKEAIEWAWELLTGVYKLDPSRMYATVFEGNDAENVAFDQEAYDMWRKFLPADHILKGNKKDNFWEMGTTGPCGPCSELHYDVRQDVTTVKGAELVNADNAEVIEIWNLVFMQFNRLADGSLQPLPSCHVDTGMGFERLCMVVQGKRSNYDTDVFQPLLTKIAELVPDKSLVNGKLSQIAMRVMADHLRAISFSIADGQLPSNVKAGYVIRRILRRAVRYGYTYLGIREPFMCKLVPTLVEQMGHQFAELKASQGLIENVICEEENSFLRTLAIGINKIENGELKIVGGVLDGAAAFELYDTYGFPIDLTELIMQEKGYKVDNAGFEKYLAEQKARSRSAAAVDVDDWVELMPIERSEFVGYDKEEFDVKIARYRKVNSKEKEMFQIVLNVTPFYGASGGQVGDCGVLVGDGVEIKIVDTLKENNLTVHIALQLPSQDKLSGAFVAKVDVAHREASAANHTATHLMHYALRSVLGDHVEQKGSLVTSDYLRFDFSHFSKVTQDELRQVERIVNGMIRADMVRDENRECTMEQAKDKGAMMLFGEKYGDKVRVIKYGDSVELCGGIHASSTGKLGLFRIVGEGSSSAGIRRIEAITGLRAEESSYSDQDMLATLRDMLGTSQFTTAIQKMANENSNIAQQMNDIRVSRDKFIIDNLKREGESVDTFNIIVCVLPFVSDSLRDISMALRGDGDNIVVIGGNHGGKPTLTVALCDRAVECGLDAGAIVRVASREIGGGGGGQKHYATAGGKNVDGIDAAIASAVSAIKAAIK